ncbi:MAG: AraC family transcriptional regulator [Longimicrobiales bacterium]
MARRPGLVHPPDVGAALGLLSGTEAAPADPRYRARLAPLVDQVRQDPAAEWSVDALARAVHFSPYHFHRVFTAVMGETAGVFVRRLRLERATQLMRAAPERELGRIAVEAGFGSASDFARTFRRHYGTAPSGWDRREPLVFRASADDAVGAKPYHLQEMVEADRGPTPQPRVEEIPARTVAFLRLRMPFREGVLERGYADFRAWLQARSVPEPHGELWGMSWDDVEVTPPEQIRYDFACPVPPDTPEGDGVRVRPMPTLRVVAAHARGDLPRVARVWHHLYHHWLPRSRYEPDNLPAFERYRHWPDALTWDDWDLDCCIPVVGLR